MIKKIINKIKSIFKKEKIAEQIDLSGLPVRDIKPKCKNCGLKRTREEMIEISDKYTFVDDKLFCNVKEDFVDENGSCKYYRNKVKVYVD